MTPDFNHVNLLTEDVEKILNTWNNGIDISSYSQDQLLKFSDFLDKAIMGAPLDYSMINFELLIKTGVSFKDGDVIQIDNGFIKLSASTKGLVKKEILNKKNFKLMKSDNNLVDYLKSKDQSYFELEMSCLVIENFLLMIKNKNYASILDMEFIEEMFLFNQSMHEQLKFLFFIMAPHEKLKQEPIFKTLYNYLFKKNTNELYMFLKKR